MKHFLLSAVAACALFVMPAVADAAEGFATSNVNLRSGPSTRYPAVIVVPAGEPVQIYGCLADTPWCDISYARVRGWVAGRYVQALYRQKRVYVDPQYYEPLGIPTVVFDIDNYWDRNYRKRDFYRDRDRWRRNNVPRIERNNDEDFGGWDQPRSDNRRDRNRRDRTEFYNGEDNNGRDRRRWDQPIDDGGIDSNRRDRQRNNDNNAAEDAARAARDAERNQQRRQEVEERRKQFQDADGNYNQGFDQDGPRTLRCKPGMEGCS